MIYLFVVFPKTLVRGLKMKSLRFCTGYLVFALTVAALLSGCHKYKTCPAHYVVEPAPPALHATGVLFATDREPKSLERLTFSAERNLAPQRLTYGVQCEHPEEEKASCTETSLAFPKAEFFRRVNAADKDVVLFIHGYRDILSTSLCRSPRVWCSAARWTRFPWLIAGHRKTGFLPMEKTMT